MTIFELLVIAVGLSMDGFCYLNLKGSVCVAAEGKAHGNHRFMVRWLSDSHALLSPYTTISEAG